MISVGSTVGNYKVVSRLGAGAMATVFLAEHPRINKRVAIKVIHHELASNKEMVSRFFTEARAASQINHENVVDILDFGQTPEGDNFMVMEYLDGQTISSRLRAAGRLDIPVALHITMQIADALATAHQKGVVHRDLKPDNIFLIRRLSNPDYVKILDFGLAKLLTGGEALQHRTSSGSVLGTPHYMAPEQCEGKSTIDGRADLYSVGCILFQMITGELPFPGDGFAEVLIKHLSEPPPRPSSVLPNMPMSVEKLILHCLAKKVDYRFQSASELLQALYDPEAFSQRIGNDPIAICGPMPGQGRPPGLLPPQLATVVGSVPAGLTTGPSMQPSADATNILASAGEPARGPNLPTIPAATIDPLLSKPTAALIPVPLSPAVPDRPNAPPLPPLPSSRPGIPRGPAVTPPALPPPLPPVGASSPPPFPGSGPPSGALSGPTPAASDRPLRELATVVGGDALAPAPLAPATGPAPAAPAPAAISNLIPLPEPPLSVPQSPAEISQLAELPVVANRAAPQMATMIGEMPPAAISALVALAPPPLTTAATSQPGGPPSGPPPPPGPAGFMELAQASSFGTDDLPSPGPPPLPLPGSSQPGQAYSSQPPVAGSSRPGISNPGVGASQSVGPRSVTERVRALPLMQKFLALPLPRRLFLVRIGAAVLAGLIALLLLLLLLPPRRATIIVRSDPDQAAVTSEGQSLGETPITVELKRNAVLKLTLRKDGYDDADEEISAEGEHVILVKLNKKSTDPEPTDTTPKPPIKPPDGKTPGKKDSGRGKKGDPAPPSGDSGKPDSGKPDSTKPDSAKPDSGKPDSGKPDSGKPDSGKPDSAKPDSAKPDSAKPDSGKPSAGKPSAGKPKKPAKPSKGKKGGKKVVVF